MQLEIGYPDILNQLHPEARTAFTRTYERVLSETRDEQKALLAAFGALRRLDDGMAIKAAKRDDLGITVGGWAVMFGTPRVKDTDNTFFKSTTEYGLDYFQDAPLWWMHGFDVKVGSEPIGHRTKTAMYKNHGIWLEHVLYKSHPIYSQLVDWAKAGKLSYSSDTFYHHMMAGLDMDNGGMDTWFLGGCSLVDDPAEPGLGNVIIVEPGDTNNSVKSAQHGVERADGLTPNAAPIDASAIGLPQPHAAKFAHLTKGSKAMNPDIAALAEMFGVEATPEAVIAALEALISGLQSAPDATDGGMEMKAEEEGGETVTITVPAEEIRSALAMKADAKNSEVAAVLGKMVAAITPKQVKVLNTSALATVYETMKNTPQNRIPAYTPQQAASNGGSSRPTSVQPVQIKGRASNKFVPAAQVGRADHQPLGNAFRAAYQKRMGNHQHKAVKAMSASIGTLGGFLLDNVVSNEIIEYLYAAQVVMAAGARTMPLDGQSLQVVKQNGTSSAYWVGENLEIGTSQPTFTTVTLVPKKLAARVLLPRELVERESFNIESIIRNDLQEQMGLAMDYSFLFGTGGAGTGNNTGASPLGLLNISGVTQTGISDGAGGTLPNGGIPGLTDLTNAVGRVEDANVPLTTGSFIGHPRTVRSFRNMVDTTGRPLFRQDWAERPQLVTDGFGWQATTAIPTTVTTGTSTDTSYIFFGNWDDAVVGMGQTIEIAVDDRQYFSSDQIQFRAIMYVDFAVFYPEAFEVITGVRAAS